MHLVGPQGAKESIMDHAVDKARARFLAEKAEGLSKALNEEIITPTVEACKKNMLDILDL